MVKMDCKSDELEKLIVRRKIFKMQKPDCSAPYIVEYVKAGLSSKHESFAVEVKSANTYFMILLCYFTEGAFITHVHG